MREKRGSIWKYLEEPNTAICITTNASVTKSGEAVMGAGVARQAKERFPEIPKRLGLFLTMNAERFGVENETQWNIPYLIWHEPMIFSFPTKPSRVRSTPDNDHVMERYRDVPPDVWLPGWQALSDLSTITRSAERLAHIVQGTNLEQVVLPQPGCGFGGLGWFLVRETIGPILDDRFLVLAYTRRKRDED